MSHKVYVVVDRNFGERLTQVAAGLPVWIVDTPANDVVIRRIWNANPTHDHLSGITSFSDLESASAEELFLMEIETIDLHHGPYSADPPYSLIETFGSPLTDRIVEALKGYGFDRFTKTLGGFTAERNISAEGDG